MAKKHFVSKWKSFHAAVQSNYTPPAAKMANADLLQKKWESKPLFGHTGDTTGFRRLARTAK
jgi:hypothetical protein